MNQIEEYICPFCGRDFTGIRYLALGQRHALNCQRKLTESQRRRAREKKFAFVREMLEEALEETEKEESEAVEEESKAEDSVDDDSEVEGMPKETGEIEKEATSVSEEEVA